MVIDADELGLEGVAWAVFGALAGITIAAVVIALVAARLGRRPFGPVSIVLGAVVAIAALVAVVVARRLVDGEATGWDVVWAIGLPGAGAWSARRLTTPATRQDSASVLARRSR